MSNAIFNAGGSRGSQTHTWSTTETWKYIPREGKWATVAPMLRARTNHTSAALNGEIYVIGGKEIKFSGCSYRGNKMKTSKTV